MSGYRDMSKMESSRNCLRRIARHDEPQFSKDSIVNVMEKFVKTVKVMDDTILVPCLLLDRQVGDSSDITPAPGKNSTSNHHTMQSISHGKRGIHNSKNVHEFLQSSELFNLYNMLKVLKNDLLWTGKDTSEDDEHDSVYGEQCTLEMENIIYARCDSSKSDASSIGSVDGPTNITNNSAAININTNTNNVTNSNTVTANAKGHNRRPSTASVASIVSTTSVCNLSDSESELSNENDSGVESEGNKSDNQPSSSESVSGSDDTDSQSAKAANADKATELAKRCRRHLNGLYQCLEQMTEAANYLTTRYQSDIGPV